MPCAIPIGQLINPIGNQKRIECKCMTWDLQLLISKCALLPPPCLCMLP